MATTAKDTASAPAPEPQPAAVPAEQMPEAGGSYTRLPDGTLKPNTHYED